MKKILSLLLVTVMLTSCFALTVTAAEKKQIEVKWNQGWAVISPTNCYDIERRMGQTFAMLCSHDGDPIYQELGEALYCWFSSVVKTEAEKLKLN